MYTVHNIGQVCDPQSHFKNSTSHLTQQCFADFLLAPIPHQKEAAQPKASVTASLQGGNNFMYIASTIIL